MADARQIVFRCPHCSVTLNAKGAVAGKEASCPKCKKKLIVPEPESAPVTKGEN